MKKQATLVLLLLLLIIIPQNNSAQSYFLEDQPLFSGNGLSDNDSPAPADSQDVQLVSRKKPHRFTITAFDQYTRFQKLKLISHTNINKLWEGENTYNFPANLIADYNNHYGTEFQNNMDGINLGYHVFDGFGVSGYVGIDRFTFKSWESPGSSQSHSTNFPAVSYGFALDYQRAVYDRIIGFAGFFYNYRSTNSINANNYSGETIESVNLKLHYWELNFLLAYPVGKFLPYVGAGYTELNVLATQVELIPTVNGNGVNVNNVSEFDSKFKGNTFYGVAGLEYRLFDFLAVYARSSFPNPLRANVGFKILL